MKPPKIQFVTVISAFALLTGCITDGNQYTWVKNSADNVEQERAQADSECLGKAYEIFSANTTPSNYCIGTCIDRGSGFSKGFQAGAAARQNKERGKARDQFYENCMLGKGWQKQPI